MLRIGLALLGACLVAGALAQGTPDIINYFGGHRGGITAVAASADGARVATAQNGVPINIFDTGTGQLSLVIEGTARQIAFSPDGQKLIGGDNSGFTVYNMTNGSALRRVGVNGYPLTFLAGAISQDGTRAAGLVSDGTAIIWNLDSGAIEKTFAVPGITATSASFSADGKTLAVGTSVGHIVLFQAADGSLSSDIAAHNGSVTTLSFHGTTIISGSTDRNVKTWNSLTGALIRQMSGHTTQVHVARMSPDGQYVVSGAAGSQLFLWNAISGGVICAFSNHVSSVRAAAFTPDSANIIAGDDGNNVNHWRIDGLALVRNFSNHKGEVDEVAISPDGKTVASGSADGTVKLWRGDTLYRTLSFGTGVLSLAFSPNSAYVAVGGGVMTRVYDANSGALLGSTFHSGVSMGVAFSQDSQTVYSTCTGGEIKRITLNGGQQWLVHVAGPVIYVAVPPSGNFIAAATLHSNQTQVWSVIHIVNIANGSVLRSWTAHTEYIRGLTFTPDDKLITGFFDGVIRAWNPTTGVQLWSYAGPAGTNSLALNPAGDVIMTGEYEDIRFLRASDGVQLRQYDEGFPNDVNTVAFSPDERWFAYGLDTGTFATAKSPLATDVSEATLVQGTTVSGSVDSLHERDENYWRMQPASNTSRGDSKVQLILKGTAFSSTASRLTFRVVAGASTATLQQDIELFDFQADKWQVVDSRACSTADQLITIGQTTNAARFLQPGTHEVRARITWKTIGTQPGQRWHSRADQAYWVIVP